MGNFSTSIAIKTSELSAVVDFLNKKKRISFVSKPYNDVIYIYDEKCDQNNKEITQLCKKISLALQCTVMAFNNHDDDVLNYWLFTCGKKIDQYNSAPSYFKSGKISFPKGGDAEKLCTIFCCQNHVEKLGDILHKKPFEKNSYAFEFERHQAICDIIGLNFDLSILSFKIIDLEDIDNSGDFIALGDTPAALFKKKLRKAEFRKELLKRDNVLLNEIVASNNVYSIPRWTLCPKTGRLYFSYSSHHPEHPKNDPNFFYIEQNKVQIIIPGPLNISNTVYNIAIDNAAKCLAVGHATGTWKSELYDLNSGELKLTIQHNTAAQSFNFSDDSMRLYCLSDFLVCVSIPDLQIIKKISIPNGTTCIGFHPGGAFAVLGCQNSIVIIDLKSNQLNSKLHLGKIQNLDAEPYFDFANAFQTIIGGMPSNIKDCMLQQVRNFEARPVSFTFSPDGNHLYMASSKGLWIYMWDELVKPTSQNPEPIKIYSFLELIVDRVLEYDQPDKLKILQHYVTYCVCCDESHHLLIYSNINGTICYVDINSKRHGILLECPGNPAIIELKITHDKRLLICTTRFLLVEGLEVPASLQIWDYQELLKRAGLN